MYYVEDYQSILVYGKTRLDHIGILSYTDLGTSCYLLSNGVFIKKILSNGAFVKFCDIDKPYLSSLSFCFLIRLCVGKTILFHNSASCVSRVKLYMQLHPFYFTHTKFYETANSISPCLGPRREINLCLEMKQTPITLSDGLIPVV